MVTLQLVYKIAFAVILAATGMVLIAIVSPSWASYSVTTAAGERLHLSVGLYRSCSNNQAEPCQPFPNPTVCEGDREGFCTAWRTLGFIAYLAEIVLLVMVVCALIVAVGPPKRREVGWKILVPGLIIAASLQLWSVSMVEYLLVNASMFKVPGWKMDSAAWWFISGMLVAAASAIGLGVASVTLEGRETEGSLTLDDPLLAGERGTPEARGAAAVEGQ